MLEPGQIFASRYRVLRHIAEGGMGAIFEAEHTATERRVALKLLFPHIMSVVSARKKFELEAKISARVNSPNIVEVLDAGFDEASKSPFLVMELLEGQTLAHHVHDQGPLGIDQALPLLQQVAAGLDAAHGYKENGAPTPIVHRDLKPENLFLAREHGALIVKILDFGIAKVLGETGNISQEVRGTPLYMAFEQVTAAALSPQTDVWAFGLIAYYALTASHYWRSANEPSANVQSLFAEILTLPLEAPSVRLVQQSASVQLPPAFDDWLLECIQRDPARRFASAGAAVEALARAFGKSPRQRGRIDSRPARGLAFASTEAWQPSLPAADPPLAATAKPPGAAAQPLATAASLPGIATEHASTPAPAQVGRSRRWLPAAAAVFGLSLAGVGWLALGGNEPSAAPPRSPARAAAAPTEAQPAPSASPVPTPAVAPVSAPVNAAEPGAEVGVAPVVAAPLIAPAADLPATSSPPPASIEPAPGEPPAAPPASVEPAPSEPPAAPPTSVEPDEAPARRPAPAVAPRRPTAARPSPRRARAKAAASPRAPKPDTVSRERAKRPTRTSDAYRMR